MLNCGHSICKGCITKHLHPFKKDSMVLCEKCTKSTQAKALKESIVLDDLAYNFNELFKKIKFTQQIYDTKQKQL
jgi:hypothetical protein